jgi:hypothetical protein
VLSSVRRNRAARARSTDTEAPAAPTAKAAEPVTATVGATKATPEAVEAAAPVKAAESAGAAAAEPAAPVKAVEPAKSETAVVPAQAAEPEPAAPPQAPEPAAVAAPAPEAVTPPAVAGPSTGSHTPRAAAALGEDGEPVEEDVEVTDLLMILDLTDEVVVVDEHPRYHLAGCSQTAGEEEFPLPLSEAREDGFTACGICRPDRHLADAERRRRAAAKA